MKRQRREESSESGSDTDSDSTNTNSDSERSESIDSEKEPKDGAEVEVEIPDPLHLREPWSVKTAVVRTIERGVGYAYAGIPDDSLPIAQSNGAIVLENVALKDIPATWTYVENLDTEGKVHMVVVPRKPSEDGKPLPPIYVFDGNRPAVWSATEVLTAPFGEWCHFYDYDFSVEVERIQDKQIPGEAPPRAYFVLGIVPKLQLAYFPLKEDTLGFYDAEMRRQPVEYWKRDFSAHLWVMCCTCESAVDMEVLTSEFGATRVFNLDAADSRFDDGAGFWATNVLPLVFAGERVAVIVKHIKDSSRLRIHELNKLARSHDMRVSVLLKDMTEIQEGVEADPLLNITSWEFPIRALGIVRSEGKSKECAWAPPRPQWTTPGIVSHTVTTEGDAGGSSN